MFVQLAEERISNMRTVRAFGKELSEVSSYTKKTDLVLSLARKEAALRAGFFGVVSVCMQMSVGECFCTDATKSTVWKVLHPDFSFLASIFQVR